MNAFFWSLFAFSLWASACSAEPTESLPYRSAVIREARIVWGLDAPVAVMAGQIEQESAWRPEVCSAYACGLTQFTTSTASWISGAHGAQLGAADVFNPAWAIRALVLYDHDLYGQVPVAPLPCDRWAFTLSSYNGGIGWVARDVALCDKDKACDRGRWWGNVALHSSRSAAAFKENRGYPDRILHLTQGHYATWGPTIRC